MKVRLALWAIVGTLAAGTPLVAHHSFAAEFDAKQAVRITGALTEIEWKLEILKEQYDSGKLSRQEYDARRKQILDRFTRHD